MRKPEASKRSEFLRSRMKRVFQAVPTLVVLIVSFLYFYWNHDQLAVLKDVDIPNLLSVILLTFLFFCATGYTFKLLVALMNVRLSTAETVGLSILTNFGNYLGPIRPGAAFKAVYLKASRGLAYTHFTSVLAANTFLALFVTGGTGIILLLLLEEENVTPPPILFLVCIGIIVCSAFPFLYKIPDIKKKSRIADLFRYTLDGFKKIRSQKDKLVLICLSFFIQFFLAALINQAVYRSIGAPISFLSAIVIGVFTSISNFMTITPNNLGVQEAIVAYLFSLTGYDYSTGIIGAGLGRIIHMSITFLLAPLFSHYLLTSFKLSLTGKKRDSG